MWLSIVIFGILGVLAAYVVGNILYEDGYQKLGLFCYFIAIVFGAYMISLAV